MILKLELADPTAVESVDQNNGAEREKGENTYRVRTEDIFLYTSYLDDCFDTMV